MFIQQLIHQTFIFGNYILCDKPIAAKIQMPGIIYAEVGEETSA